MNYIAITSPDINNGSGCRVTLWIAGCSHKCLGCHNPGSHDYSAGKPLNECKEELFEILSKPYIKGVTISGGDPLDQHCNSLAELESLLIEIKKRFPEKDIWLYTGFYLDDIMNGRFIRETDNMRFEVISLCDVIVDGPFILKERDVTLPFRGSKNQRIHFVKDLL